MVRTVVSLDSEDKEWLDRKAREEHVAMTELVRRAVKRMRQEDPISSETFDTLLSGTSGMWQAGDGLRYQLAIREEWDARK